MIRECTFTNIPFITFEVSIKHSQTYIDKNTNELQTTVENTSEEKEREKSLFYCFVSNFGEEMEKNGKLVGNMP
jgi:hypothetical protein